MDLKQIFASVEIDEEKAEQLVNLINKELPKSFVPKDQYNKKTSELAEVKKDLQNALESNQNSANLLEKLESLKEDNKKLKLDYENYKTSIETKTINEQKKEVLKTKLLNDGAVPDVVDLLVDKFDLSTIELEQGGLPDEKWQEISTPIKAQYGTLFGKITEQGATIGNPPTFNNNKLPKITDEISKLNEHRII